MSRFERRQTGLQSRQNAKCAKGLTVGRGSIFTDLTVEGRHRAFLVLTGQMIGIENAQVDQLVESFLAQLLTPQDGRNALPAFLQEVSQKQIGM